MSEPKDHEPMTEEQMRATVIGELHLHNAPIELAEYDPSWPPGEIAPAMYTPTCILFRRVQSERNDRALGG